MQGRTEVELVNLVIYGAAQLVKMEVLLEAGQPLEPLLAEMEMYRSRAQESFAYVFSSEHTIQAHHAEGPADPEQLASIEAARSATHGGEGGVEVVPVPGTPGRVVLPPAGYGLSAPPVLDEGEEENAPADKSKSCVVQ